MATRLSGKTVVITGAGNGQGAAAARLFVEEGARVAALDINADALDALAAEFDRETLLPIHCDVSDGESVSAAVAQIVEAFDTVNVLHNNAGTSLRKNGPWDDSQDGALLDITEEIFDRSIAINLKSVFYMTRNVMPLMIEAGGGSIINVSSLSGALAGSTSHAYCASKGAVAGLTRGLALSYGPSGVRVNAICPGLIETPLVAHITSNPEHLANYTKGAPLRRIGKPIDVANVALFLASDESSFMTGSILTVDGGVMVA